MPVMLKVGSGSVDFPRPSEVEVERDICEHFWLAVLFHIYMFLWSFIYAYIFRIECCNACGCANALCYLRKVNYKE